MCKSYLRINVPKVLDFHGGFTEIFTDVGVTRVAKGNMRSLREKTNVKIELTFRINVFRKRNRECQKLYTPV